MYKQIILLSWVLLAMQVVAGNATDNLSQKLAQMKYFSADFTQKTFADGQLLQSVNGKIRWQQPSAFYWQALAPQAQILVGNGQKIYHYDQDLEQVLVQDYQAQQQHSPLMMILANAENVQQYYHVVEIPATEKTVFELTAKDKKAPVQKVVLVFAKTLSAMQFFDSLQQKTDVSFQHANTDKIDASLFDFTVPDGVDVLHE